MTRLDDWAPSLRAHYRHFLATTSPSAPVPRIGTLALVGLPLGRLPWHRGDRFPGGSSSEISALRHDDRSYWSIVSGRSRSSFTGDLRHGFLLDRLPG